ncbi:MAG: apolipoprotein N-acyltransferase [Candidatus Omnitrophota bacterium]
MKRLFQFLLTAALLIFSFPPFDLGFLAYLAFVPFFFALENISLKKTAWLSTLTGYCFFLGLIHWLHHVTWPGTLFLIFYLSLYFTLFGVGLKLIDKRWCIFVAPFFWVVLEFLRTHLLTGFGWALLGYSQWRALGLIQFADTTGVYGVSFLVMATNATLYELLRKRGRRTVRIFSVLFLNLFLFFSWGYGKTVLSRTFPDTFRATVIQGNIPQDLKWDISVQDLIMTKYERLTEVAAQEKTDAVFWPETAVPGFLPDDDALLERLAALNRKTKTYLLAGSPWSEKELTYNSALLLYRGEILQRYDKLHLVPYGEFIPLEEQFPMLRDWIVTGDFYPGKEATIFKHPKGTFSVLVCFEDIFPDLVRRFASKADFLVNITNDAWFGKSASPFQHAQASVFRAIENRRSVLRVTNTGYTCLIDPAGRILQDLELGGEKLFVTGFRTWEVPLSKTTTFYLRFGDLFAWVCHGITLLSFSVFLFLNALKKK